MLVERVLSTGCKELVDAQTELPERPDAIHQTDMRPARGIGVAACRRRQEGEEMGKDVGQGMRGRQ